MILKRVLMALTLMVSPMTPHIAEELWEMLGFSGGLAKHKWPRYREDLTGEEQVEIIIQVNGRVRSKILVDEGLGENETRETALGDPRIKVTDLEARLDPARFVRVHRGEIIQLQAVVRVDALFHGDAVAELDDGSSVVISRTHRDAFFARWRGR